MLRTLMANSLHHLANLIGGIDYEAKRETNNRATAALAKIMQSAEEKMAAHEAEMDRRAEMGMLDAVAPEIWRNSWYMRQGYRALHTHDPAQNHWRGGPAQHDGAECPVCKKPLLLFWDIDCNDSRFSSESKLLFDGIKRLPLYYCCRRPEPTLYQVVSPDRILTFGPELLSYEESPFRVFPEEFARKPISLNAIPRDVENLLAIINNFDFAWLNGTERSLLRTYLQREIDGRWDIELSQFGGAPLLLQGHQGIKCPNPTCPTLHMGNPLLGGCTQFEMKELAVIGQSSGFEFEMNCCQIVFHICWKCLTIRAQYACD